MKKAKDIKNLLEKPVTNELILGKDIKNFIDELLEITKLFNKSSRFHHYEIEIKPYSASDSKNINDIFFKIEEYSKKDSYMDKSKIFFEYSTIHPLYKVEGVNGYEKFNSPIIGDSDYLIKETLIFNNNVTIFKEIIENFMVENFLRNEKSAQVENSFMNLINEPRKIKIK